MTVELPLWAPYLAVVCLAVLAWLARVRPCSCEQCVVHVTETRRKREAERVQRHRDLHRQYRIPWDEAQCAACRAGGLDDKP